MHYHWKVNRRVASEQIEAAARALLRGRRQVTVQALRQELRSRHGAGGRTERIAGVLRRMHQELSTVPPAGPGGEELEQLHQRVRDAEARAARAEQLERSHQDFWARRYGEKMDELERRYASALKGRAPISADQHLRLLQENAELRRRLLEHQQRGPEG